MTSHGSHPVVAREGWVHVGIAIVVAVLVSVIAGWIWALPLWIVVVFVVQFFRDPHRVIPEGAGMVVAPADGRVVALGEADDHYVNRRAQKISIFMNVFSVHSNRSPVGGEIRGVWYHQGSFINAALDKASVANERNAMWIRTEGGEDIICVQVAGLIARRILCYVSKDDRVERGQRYGFIRFGSRVDLYLPVLSDIRVRLGQTVRAGADTVALLPGT